MIGDDDDDVDDDDSTCSSFQNYMKCSQSVVEATCGSQTATFTRGFLDTMAGPLIQGYCLTYDAEDYDCDLMELSRPAYEQPDQALERLDMVSDETDSSEVLAVGSRAAHSRTTLYSPTAALVTTLFFLLHFLTL